MSALGQVSDKEAMNTSTENPNTAATNLNTAAHVMVNSVPLTMANINSMRSQASLATTVPNHYGQAPSVAPTILGGQSVAGTEFGLHSVKSFQTVQTVQTVFNATAMQAVNAVSANSAGAAKPNGSSSSSTAEVVANKSNSSQKLVEKVDFPSAPPTELSRHEQQMAAAQQQPQQQQNTNFPQIPLRKQNFELMRMLLENKDCVKMRARMNTVLQRWDPVRASQFEAIFGGGSAEPGEWKAPVNNARPGGWNLPSSPNEALTPNQIMHGGHCYDDLNTLALVDYRPGWTFLHELKSAVDAEMQDVWRTYADETASAEKLESNNKAEKKENDLGNALTKMGETKMQVETLGLKTTSKETAVSSKNSPDDAVNPDVFLQRKFNPLAEGETAVDDVFFSLLNETKLSKNRKRRKLIVVASLIDKTPNLAGLARTCEIFNAEALVVNNRDCVKDKEFTAISVTAEQWMPLWEVPVLRLKQFFAEQKARGYTIVGVEQTHTSVCLSEFQFPQEKVLLFLGAEKEGIPAELISACDVTVEIPQAGVLRSLNVHVSGALLVWEYVRQISCMRG